MKHDNRSFIYDEKWQVTFMMKNDKLHLLYTRVMINEII